MIDSYLVMQEKQWLPAFRLNFQLYDGFAPYIFSIKGVNFVTWLDFFQLVFIQPFVMIF